MVAQVYRKDMPALLLRFLKQSGEASGEPPFGTSGPTGRTWSSRSRSWPERSPRVETRTAPRPRVAYDAPGMVKADLIRRAMVAANLESPAAQAAVNALFESVAAALERGDRVVLRQFGVFHTGPRKTGVARNPRTNEPVGIPRGRVVRFRPAPGLQSFPGGN